MHNTAGTKLFTSTECCGKNSSFACTSTGVHVGYMETREKPWHDEGVGRHHALEVMEGRKGRSVRTEMV